MTEFFRSEVLSGASKRLDGTVLLATPLEARVLLAIFCAIVIAVTTLVSTATYARKETVIGWLTPARGVVRAIAPRGGQIDELLVREGDTVAESEPIARLRLSSYTDSGDTSESIIAALSDQVDAAQRESEAELARLEQERVQRAAAIELLQRERRSQERQLQLQAERLALVEAEISRLAPIAERGLIATRDVEARQSDLLQARQGLANLEASLSSIDRRIHDETSALAAIPLESEVVRAQAAANQAMLSERSLSALQNARAEIRAPVSSRVAVIPVRDGQTLSAGQTVAILVPDGDQLIAELYAPSRAAGFIETGQQVRLMYQAFPHERFGVGEGTVRRISTTVLAPEEVSIPGVQLAEPVFRIDVALGSETIDAYGQTISLQPGMLLSAEIVIDRRTLIQWLFDPLYAVARRR